MKIIIGEDFNKMSKMAADGVFEVMGARKQPLICPASGHSPQGVYKEIVERGQSNPAQISDWLYVGLDEWGGLNENDEGSCLHHLNLDLFDPLHVAREKICFFNGRANDLEKECEKVENFIEQCGGIDVAILGLGMNGHIGMNEPGTSVRSRTHVAKLHETTQNVGQKYFKKKTELTHGVTLGIDTLMDARNLFLIISGTHKADIAQKVIEDDISENLPGTLLRRHPNLRVYLDAEAASKIVG